MHLFRLYLALHVLRQVSELYMTTVTAVLAMDGIGKGGGGDLIAVATQAGGWINGHFLGG
jgi:hypothetical protein